MNRQYFHLIQVVMLVNHPMSEHIFDTQHLQSAVQHNCDIADARYAGNYTLCTYLLKMREFYRWEQRIPFSDVLEHAEVGSWVEQQESSWDQIEDEGYQCIPLPKKCYDPFEVDAINAYLAPAGLVYGAGFARGARPVFFVGELITEERYEGYRVLVSARELARDLAAPPAMAQGNTIYIRRESIRRMVFEMIEAWRWRSRPDDPMARAMACYNFAQDREAALEDMTDNEVESAIWHEVGEILAGNFLGDGWEPMIMRIAGSREEIVVRAVRDHLADCLSTLPALIEADNASGLHFYFANFTALRKELFPQAMDAYNTWSNGGSLKPLKQLIPGAREHWLTTGQRLMDELSDSAANTCDSCSNLASLRPVL